MMAMTERIRQANKAQYFLRSPFDFCCHFSFIVFGFNCVTPGVFDDLGTLKVLNYNTMKPAKSRFIIEKK